jgi:hypothetical protein
MAICAVGGGGGAGGGADWFDVWSLYPGWLCSYLGRPSEGIRTVLRLLIMTSFVLQLWKIIENLSGQPKSVWPPCYRQLLLGCWFPLIFGDSDQPSVGTSVFKFAEKWGSSHHLTFGRNSRSVFWYGGRGTKSPDSRVCPCREREPVCCNINMF